jgi:hypothetical protein
VRGTNAEVRARIALVGRARMVFRVAMMEVPTPIKPQKGLLCLFLPRRLSIDVVESDSKTVRKFPPRSGPDSE